MSDAALNRHQELVAMMTKMGAKLAEQSDQIAELTAQVAALSVKPEKQEKPEKPVTATFAGLYGALMLNADGSGKRFRHIAELKNGGDDEQSCLAWNVNESRDLDCPAVRSREGNSALRCCRTGWRETHRVSQSSWNFCCAPVSRATTRRHNPLTDSSSVRRPTSSASPA